MFPLLNTVMQSLCYSSFPDCPIGLTKGPRCTGTLWAKGLLLWSPTSPCMQRKGKHRQPSTCNCLGLATSFPAPRWGQCARHKNDKNPFKWQRILLRDGKWVQSWLTAPAHSCWRGSPLPQLLSLPISPAGGSFKTSKCFLYSCHESQNLGDFLWIENFKNAAGRWKKCFWFWALLGKILLRNPEAKYIVKLRAEKSKVFPGKKKKIVWIRLFWVYGVLHSGKIKNKK